MIRPNDISDLSDFSANASAHLDRLAKSKSAEVLMEDGEARGVVMSPSHYDELCEKAARHDSLAMIDRSMEDIKAGRHKDFRDAIREIADKLGLDLDHELSNPDHSAG